ncbi:hypothetical protein CEXT_383251 [Caerostris extrusa]|uniref:Uncharacterized protein n=1 Tax=Caerostris extrusa TaxID=172846 RepID=A0AAV4NM70_CAEEX|nr:hypothetical protein CEXT_383251 [Caerostris extrusa]
MYVSEVSKLGRNVFYCLNPRWIILQNFISRRDIEKKFIEKTLNYKVTFFAKPPIQRRSIKDRALTDINRKHEDCHWKSQSSDMNVWLRNNVIDKYR